ncbi:hypothetical protein [Parasulfitobacter algicola]|uniref:Uncharacterized protein n=1 Tax=Parasulfitobacter algicola TaxID=2614809 RepID=A0ABX2IVK3_9RHOB|nr:hypothetical protein [Sulfitobacter algicola]NSX54399.1 hypothetical protein [Sulfitobacter algicola]
MNFKFDFIALCSCLSVASLSHAECVTAADMANGIIVKLDDGSTEHHRTKRPDLVEVIWTPAEEDPSSILYGKGIYLLQMVSVIDGVTDVSSRVTIGYDKSVADLVVLPSNGQLTEQTFKYSPYTGFVRETITYMFSDPAEIQVAGCTYLAQLINVIAVEDSTTFEQNIVYVPSLGTSFITSYRSDNEEFYDINIQSITAAE